MTFRSTSSTPGIPLLRLGLLGALSLSATAFGNLLTNGSFEDPAVPSDNYLNYPQGSWIGPVGTGWQVTAVPFSYGIPAVLHDNYVGGGVTWPTPSDGSQFLYLGNSTAPGSTIAQHVALSAGISYQLSFDLADFQADQPVWAGHSPGEVYVDILDSGANSILGGAQHYATAAFAGFTTFDLSFTPSVAGDYSVTFVSINERPANLDNIQLNASHATGVPDSGPTLALLAGGLALLPIVRRTTKRQAA